ncbi:MAG: glycosyltransferase [Burkholderiaceae bacterium]
MLSISVALCTFNGARFLESQLRSLTTQTRLPTELVVCDDASQDTTWSILEAFAKHAPFSVRLVRNASNMGYVKNFEQAISLCRSSLVMLCDQDDVWHPSKLERVHEIFWGDSSVGIVLHGYECIDAEGEPFHTVPDFHGPRRVPTHALGAELAQHSLEAFVTPRHKAWCGCMTAFRQEFVDLLVPIFPGKGHDDWIQKLLAPLTETRFIPTPLIEYRIHPNNANNHEAQQGGARLRLKKLRNRWLNIFRGHSKRHFYQQILLRIASSNRPVRYPRLLQYYKRFTRLL